MKGNEKQFNPSATTKGIQKIASVVWQSFIFLLLSFFAVRFIVEGSPTLGLIVIGFILYMTWNMYRKTRKP